MKNNQTRIPICAAILTVAIVAAGLHGPAAAAAAHAPTVEELAAATYRGLDESPVTLTDGHWEGEPVVEGSASIPRVDLAPGFRVAGDLDGDGADEVVALLYQNFGGSGVFAYLAVVGRSSDGGVENLDTVAIGDRVQLRSAVIDGGSLTIETVESGPGDGACCPGQLMRRGFTFEESRLVERSSQDLGRFGISALEGTTWRLTRWAPGEELAGNIVIDLVVEGDRVAGRSGCNRYQGGVTTGELPGDLSVTTPLAVTMMACPTPIGEAETRYLAALQNAFRFRFQAGRLMIDWNDGESGGSLAFGETGE